MSPAPRLPMRHCRISPPRCNSAQGAHCLGNRKAALPAQRTEACAIRPEPAQAASHARFAPAQSAFSGKTLPTGNALSRQLRTTPPTRSSVPYISAVSMASIPSSTPRRRAHTSSERAAPCGKFPALSGRPASRSQTQPRAFPYPAAPPRHSAAWGRGEISVSQDAHFRTSISMSSRGFPPSGDTKDIRTFSGEAETSIRAMLELTTFGTFMPSLSAG